MSHLRFWLVSLIWGSNFILMKKALLAFGPMSVGAWRVFGGALVLAVFWIWRGGGWPFRREHFGPLIFLVVVAYAWPFALLPWLIQRNGSAFIGMMIGLVPLLTIVVSMPMIRVYPTRPQLLGVLGGMGCLGLIMSDGLQRAVPLGDLLLAVTVPLGYALGNTYVRRRFASLAPLPLSCTALTLAAVMLIPLSLPEPVAVDEHFGLALTSLVLVALLPTGVAMYLFYRMIQEQGPLFAGMTAYLIPLGAVAWGWLDQERVTATQVVALAGILAMVAVVQFNSSPVRPQTEMSTP